MHADKGSNFNQVKCCILYLLASKAIGRFWFLVLMFAFLCTFVSIHPEMNGLFS